MKEQTNSIFSNEHLTVFMGRIFATVKFGNESRAMKPVLNLFHILFLGASCAIGSGAYLIVGLAAQRAGPGVLFTFIIVGVLCFFTCFPYAEFAGKIHSSGFSYSFIYASCGELLGYLTGHALHIMNMVSAVIMARCWASYFAGFLELIGIHIPRFLIEWEFCGFKIAILAALLVLALCILMLRGVKDSTTVNNVVSMINVTTLILAIIVGTQYVDIKNYQPFMPFGVKGVVSGMGLAFYAFLGFEGISCFTEEAIRPNRDIPIALVGVLFVSVLIHSGLALVMTGMAPLSILNVNESLLAAYKYSGPSWMIILIAFGSLAGLTASTSATLMLQPRTFYSMAYDRLIPKRFMQDNPKTHVPEFAIYVTLIISVTITLFFDVELAGNTISLAGLLVSANVDIAIVAERYKSDSTISKAINKLCFVFYFDALLLGFSFVYNWNLFIKLVLVVPLVFSFLYAQVQEQTNIPEHFKCPFVPLIPMLGCLSFVILASTIDYLAWIIFIIYTGIGVASYFLYGYYQSKLNPNRKNTADNMSIEDNSTLNTIETELKEKLQNNNKSDSRKQ